MRNLQKGVFIFSQNLCHFCDQQTNRPTEMNDLSYVIYLFVWLSHPLLKTQNIFIENCRMICWSVCWFCWSFCWSTDQRDKNVKKKWPTATNRKQHETNSDQQQTNNNKKHKTLIDRYIYILYFYYFNSCWSVGLLVTVCEKFSTFYKTSIFALISGGAGGLFLYILTDWCFILILASSLPTKRMICLGACAPGHKKSPRWLSGAERKSVYAFGSAGLWTAEY